MLSANIAREEMQVGIANEKHAIFALGVTLLSIAITLSGMSIIASRQVLWYAGIVLGSAECPRVLGDLPLPVIRLVNSHRLAPESHVHYISPASDSYVRPCGSSSGRPTWSQNSVCSKGARRMSGTWTTPPPDCADWFARIPGSV